MAQMKEKNVFFERKKNSYSFERMIDIRLELVSAIVSMLWRWYRIVVMQDWSVGEFMTVSLNKFTIKSALLRIPHRKTGGNKYVRISMKNISKPWKKYWVLTKTTIDPNYLMLALFKFMLVCSSMTAHFCSRFEAWRR